MKNNLPKNLVHPPKPNLDFKLRKLQDLRTILKIEYQERAIQEMIEVNFDVPKEILVGVSTSDGTIYDESMGIEIVILDQSGRVSEKEYFALVRIIHGISTIRLKDTKHRQMHLAEVKSLAKKKAKFIPFVNAIQRYFEKEYEIRILDALDRSL